MTSVRPMVPANGAASVRLARSSSALCRSISAFCTAVRASASATVVMLLDLASCSARSQRGLRRVEGDLAALDRDLLVGVVEADQRLAGGDRACRA